MALFSSDKNDAYDLFRLKFQRDVNRLVDTDRNTRRRGMQELLNSLPWTSENENVFLQTLIMKDLLEPILDRVADPVEKCRDLSISFLEKIFCTCRELEAAGPKIIKIICSRIDEIPFPEPTEELRLRIIQILHKAVKHPAIASSLSDHANIVIIALGKVLQDAFPSVKKETADLIVDLSHEVPMAMRLHFKVLQKGLSHNATHQHSKVRIPTLKALEASLCCVTGEYDTVMKDVVGPLFTKIVADHVPAVRQQLADLCGALLRSRWLAKVHEEGLRAELSGDTADLDVMRVLLQVASDVAPEVAERGLQNLSAAAQSWDILYQHNQSCAMEVVPECDRQTQTPSDTYPSSSGSSNSNDDDDIGGATGRMLRAHIMPLCSALLECTDGWTAQSRNRSLRALHLLITSVGGAAIIPLLPNLLKGLSVSLEDE
eukprot:gene8750-18094_t